MEGQELAFTCSTVELTCLASLLGATAILGVEDPFAGWLAEEVESAWQTARQRLAERRALALQPDGRVALDTRVAALVGTCARPQASLIVSHVAAGGQPARYRYHVGRHLAVEAVEEAGAWRLRALPGAQAVCDRIGQVWGLSRQPAAPGAALTLPHDALRQARPAALEGGADAAGQVLARPGIDGAAAAALAAALAGPLTAGALVALSWRETVWEVAGMGLLEGVTGLWRLRCFRRLGQAWVEATPCDAAAAAAEIRRLMNRVLPVPLAAA